MNRLIDHRCGLSFKTRIMKKYVVVDVDGTIAEGEHRVHLITQEKPDWNSFFDACDQDYPIAPIIGLVVKLSRSYNIVFATGRHDKVRDKTQEWIERYLGFTMAPILMRETGDHRHDTEVKPELLAKAGLNTKNVAFIIEDRNSMVKHWRSLGYTVLQCAEGDF